MSRGYWYIQIILTITICMILGNLLQNIQAFYALNVYSLETLIMVRFASRKNLHVD